MEIIVKSFEELTTQELYNLLKLRSEIFVVEQNCVYNDLDNNDQVAFHLMVKDEKEKIVGYARMLNQGTRFEQASIGRLVVNKEFRMSGIARRIMTDAAKWMLGNWNVRVIHISAQKYLKAFYLGIGYQIVTDPYLEDGIPHIGMDLHL